MKVLIATDNYYPNVNGASYAAQRLATALKDAGQDVLVVAPARGYRSERFAHEGVSIWGVPSFPFERIRIPTPVFGTHDVISAITAWKPDVIHVESHFGIGRTAARYARRARIPVVGTNHFMPENLVHYLPITDLGRRITAYFMWKYFLITFNRVAIVTTPTHTAARLLKSVGFKRDVEVISNGIDLERFSPDNDGEEVVHRYELPDVPRLLYVGRLDREKNIDLVVRAFAQARAHADFHLIVAGTGAEGDNLTRLAHGLGIAEHVTFTGFVPDDILPRLYAASHAFVMAGTAELQSIVTMEAMATGLPVIAVNAVALPELVDSTNGFVYEHGNVEAVTNAMVALFSYEGLRKHFSIGSLKRIQHHAAGRVTQKYLNVYERAITSAR